MDICGPMGVQSIGGSKYFLLVTDEHTRYRKVYFLKKKSNASENFKLYVNAAQNETGKIPIAIWTDGGGEFTSTEFKKYLGENGIRAELTVAYTPQEVGISEVGNRIIVGRAYAMMQHASAPKSYWAEAVVTAVQLSNVSIAKGNGGAKTPHKMLTGSKPEVQHLRIWGCAAYTKIWKFHDPIKKRTFTSRDVVFYEEEPYHGNKSGEVNGESSESVEEKREMMDLVNWPARIVAREDIEEPTEGPRLV